MMFPGNRKLIIIIFMVIALSWHTIQAETIEKHVTQNPTSYVLDKTKTNDIVFLGTTHKDPQILNFIVKLLPELEDTYIGLEIPSDQQDKIDQYLISGNGLENIPLHYAINCPEYRNLLATLRKVSQENRLKVIALDLPTSLYSTDTYRDEWMAQSINSLFDQDRNSKVLIIVGVHHVLKAIEWEDSVRTKHGSIRTYLNNSRPDLKAFSICFSDPNDDFSKYFRNENKPLAVDCDGLFSDWELCVLENAAAKPMKAHETVNGVIVR